MKSNVNFFVKLNSSIKTICNLSIPNQLRNLLFLILFALSTYGYFQDSKISFLGIFISVWYFAYCFDTTGKQFAYKMKNRDLQNNEIERSKNNE